MGCNLCRPKKSDDSINLNATSDSAGHENGFRSKYKAGELLGEGAFSKVYKCINVTTRELYACKIVPKSGLSQQDEEALRSEVEILTLINSPHVAKCVDFFDEEKTFYVVLEYLEGGELFDRIVKKTVYTEAEGRELVRILLLAIKACHDKLVAHRDLKPENLLLKSKTDDKDVKVADFGFAAIAENDHCLSAQCGTPGYVAPEILLGDLYGRPADMWSIGVITYILLGGYPPFYDDNQKMLFRKIKSGDYKFDEAYWKGVSTEAQDLISNLLVVNPDKRFNVDQALAHAWLRKDTADLASRTLNDQLMELRKFNARRKFRSAVKAIVAVNRIKLITGGSSKSDNYRSPSKL